MGTILKGIGVIKSVSPKVKNKGIAKSKGNISKSVGQARKYQEEREVIMEENLKRAKEGKESIYGTLKETEKEIENIGKEKIKFPSKENEENMMKVLEFEVTPEYKEGGLVKKGFLKIAKRLEIMAKQGLWANINRRKRLGIIKT
jgi:hypothetical protein